MFCFTDYVNTLRYNSYTNSETELDDKDTSNRGTFLNRDKINEKIHPSLHRNEGGSRYQSEKYIPTIKNHHPKPQNEQDISHFISHRIGPFNDYRRKQSYYPNSQYTPIGTIVEHPRFKNTYQENKQLSPSSSHRYNPNKVQQKVDPTVEEDHHGYYEHEYEEHDHDHHHPEFEIVHYETTQKPTEPPKEHAAYLFNFYHIGYKLFYVPLYAAIIFITFVLYLVLRDITRHKVLDPYNFLTNSGRKLTSQLDNNTHTVMKALVKAKQRYQSQTR